MVKKYKKPEPFPETPFDNDTDDHYVVPTSSRPSSGFGSSRSSRSGGMKRRVHDPDRGLNIAMACILAAVVLAIIISLAVFFATPAKTPSKGYAAHSPNPIQAPAPNQVSTLTSPQSQRSARMWWGRCLSRRLCSKRRAVTASCGHNSRSKTRTSLSSPTNTTQWPTMRRTCDTPCWAT